MRKRILPFIAIIMLAFVGACSNEDVLAEVGSETNPELTGRSLSFTASMPDEDNPATRASVEEEANRSIALTWNANDKIDLLFVQGTNKKNNSATVEIIDGTGKNATFTVVIPEGINEAESFNLYGVYGGGEVSTTNPELIKLPAIEGTTLNEENVGKNVMLRFANTIDATGVVGAVNFEHVGFLFTAKIKVTAGSVNDITGVQLIGTGSDATWAYNASDNHFDMEAGTFTNEVTGTNSVSFQNAVKDTENNILTVRNWFPAIGTAWPALQLSINDGTIETVDSKPSRTPAVGKAYYLYATWDGTDLAFANRADVDLGNGTKENPYSVAEAMAKQDGSYGWVKAYIVGYKISSNTIDFDLTQGNANIKNNIAIADNKDEKVESKVVGVQLPSGVVRAALNLNDNPTLLKAEVLLYGSLENYFGTDAGLKNVSEYEILATTPLFKADKSSISFTSSVDLISTISIITNDMQAWTAVSDALWLSVSPESGTGGGAVTVTAQGNIEATERTAIVTLTPTGDTGLAPVVVTVTQAAFAPFIDVAPTSLTFEKEAGSRTIDVTANIAWTATSNTDWLTLTPASGTNDGAITVDAAANSGADARNATITIIGGGLTKTVAVTQAGTTVVFATDLFFSEYIEGSSNNKYLEIYNGTGAPVELTDYEVVLYSNGATERGNNIQLTGTLAQGGVFVIANSSGSIYSGADATSTVTYFNGDDAVALQRISTGDYVDIIGRIGEQVKWNAGGNLRTENRTLIRKPDVTDGVTINPSSGFPTLATEWIGHPQDYQDLGKHTTSY